jgi:hypothetical protein
MEFAWHWWCLDRNSMKVTSVCWSVHSVWCANSHRMRFLHFQSGRFRWEDVKTITWDRNNGRRGDRSKGTGWPNNEALEEWRVNPESVIWGWTRTHPQSWAILHKTEMTDSRVITASFMGIFVDTWPDTLTISLIYSKAICLLRNSPDNWGRAAVCVFHWLASAKAIHGHYRSVKCM